MNEEIVVPLQYPAVKIALLYASEMQSFCIPIPS
jgi:hypothetical protein